MHKFPIFCPMSLFPNRQALVQTLGPGIVFASTCIGVSHLVQSTRAGADYGFALLWAVLLANLFKYPFFEFGSRYANVTGTSILDGYAKQSKWVIGGYGALTLGTLFFVAAAVGAVTAGFLDNLFGVGNLPLITGVLLAGTVVVLALGKYGVLDSLIKLIGAVLLISTLVAFGLALGKGPVYDAPLLPTIDWGDGISLGFLIALMGWMPTAVDMSAWNSLWTVERMAQTGFRPTLKQTLFDFNFGYVASTMLAVCFVVLGAFLLHGTPNPAPKPAAAFAGVVVKMYTEVMGPWSRVLIGAAAFSIMLGTCIAVFDGYARAMKRCGELLLPKPVSNTYILWLVLIGAGAYGVIHVFIFNRPDDPTGFRQLVDFATTMSFLVAPLVAFANYRLVVSGQFPKEGRPPQWLRVLAIAGMAFLVGFCLVYFLA